METLMSKVVMKNVNHVNKIYKNKVFQKYISSSLSLQSQS